MKRKVVLSLVLASTLKLSAQTITPNQVVEVGDRILTKTAYNVPVNVLLGMSSSGGGETFNFSNLSASSPIDTIDFPAPDWTPCGTEYPTANLAMVRKSSPNTYYYYNKTSGSGMNLIGVCDSTATPPADKVHLNTPFISFPFNGSTKTHVSSFIMEQSAYGIDPDGPAGPLPTIDSLRLTRYDSVVEFANNTGEIIIPTDTFPMYQGRDQVVEEYTADTLWMYANNQWQIADSTLSGILVLQTISFDTVIRLRYWVTENISVPLAPKPNTYKYPLVDILVDNNDYFTNKGTPMFITVNALEVTWVTSPKITSVKENAALENVKLYPIPANNELIISNTVKIKQIEVYNISGKMILSEKISASKTHRITTSEFNSGIYFVAFYDGKGNKTTKKFIVNH